VIEEALAAKLVSAVGTSVGGPSDPRIRPDVLAQPDTFPAIVYRQTSAGQDPPISGKDDMPAPEFEITCWDRTRRGATTLARAVKTALEDEGRDTWAYSGGSVVVHSVTLLESETIYDDESQGSDKPIYGTAQTYEVIHEA
jgi:hypothetical protein